MIEGLWIVQYMGLAGHDSGTVVLMKGKAYGGDNGFVYTGTYEESGTGISAKIDVRNFNPAVKSILAIEGDYTISATLRFLDATTLQGNATITDPPSVGIVLKLSRFCAL